MCAALKLEWLCELVVCTQLALLMGQWMYCTMPARPGIIHSCLVCLGCGGFHVELKATSRGPRLIEINARMGGGGVR
jgi:hypothetical protein